MNQMMAHIEERISALTQEAEELIQKSNDIEKELESQRRNTTIRLTQIAGAIQELDSLKASLKITDSETDGK